jgi:hypothetical protein
MDAKQEKKEYIDWKEDIKHIQPHEDDVFKPKADVKNIKPVAFKLKADVKPLKREPEPDWSAFPTSAGGKPLAAAAAAALRRATLTRPVKRFRLPLEFGLFAQLFVPVKPEKELVRAYMALLVGTPDAVQYAAEASLFLALLKEQPYETAELQKEHLRSIFMAASSIKNVRIIARVLFDVRETPKACSEAFFGLRECHVQDRTHADAGFKRVVRSITMSSTRKLTSPERDAIARFIYLEHPFHLDIQPVRDH